MQNENCDVELIDDLLVFVFDAGNTSSEAASSGGARCFVVLNVFVVCFNVSLLFNVYLRQKQPLGSLKMSHDNFETHIKQGTIDST